MDKYVKTNLVSDTLRVVTMPKEQLPFYSEIGCLKRILPTKSMENSLDEFQLYSHFEKLFEFLSGNKNYDFMTMA